MANDKKERMVSGPKPEHVHIEGNWEEAVKRALKKPPPPKPDTKKPPAKVRGGA
jgi:hypothetical protein